MSNIYSEIDKKFYTLKSEIIEREANGDFNSFEFIGYCILKHEGVIDIEKHCLAKNSDYYANKLISLINEEYEEVYEDLNEFPNIIKKRDKYFDERVKMTILIARLINLFYDYNFYNLISPDLEPNKKFII